MTTTSIASGIASPSSGASRGACARWAAQKAVALSVRARAAHVKARVRKDCRERFRVIGRLLAGADQQDVARRGAMQRLDAERGDRRRAAAGDGRAVEREAHFSGGGVVRGDLAEDRR
ncbi:hypothetical protein QT587_22580, partial [Xanthomonas citri pv. citri]